MSVVSVWYTRAAHMVDGDTGHKFIWSPRARAPAAMSPRAPRGSAVAGSYF
jgi:hypothetical protein